MDEATERNLVERAKSREWTAFDALVEAHQERVYGLAYGLTGRHEEADSVTHDVFIQAYYALSRFDHRSRFMTWLHTITVRKVLRLRRRPTSGLPTISLDDAEGLQVSSDGRRPGAREPSEDVGRRELEALLRRALAKIPVKKRAALVLVAQQGRSYKEAARLLGCSEGALAWRVWDARRRLRELLSPYMGQESTDSWTSNGREEG